MKNGICMRAVTNSVENELSHHGILGMSWGKRFGPPYPLGGVDKKVARAEAKRKKQQEKRVAALQKAAKKARKAKVKAAKKEKKELERQVKINEQKQKLLEEDNYKKIMKNHKLFTSEELKYVKERHDQQIADKLDRMISKAAKVTTLVNTVSNVSQGMKMLQGLKTQAKLDSLNIKAKNLEIQETTNAIARAARKYEFDQKNWEYDMNKKSWDVEKARGDAGQSLNKSSQEFYKAMNEKQKAKKALYDTKFKVDQYKDAKAAKEAAANATPQQTSYKFKPSGVNISQLANRHTQSAQATPVTTQQVMETRISDLSRSPYTSAMATKSGQPYANRTINNMLNNMTTEYYQRQVPSSSELKDMLKNSKNNYSFYNMLL